jgi:gliding motility-associated protein GldC
MKKSEIKFTVDLDDNNVPEKIFWEATDNPTGKMEETKAIAISLFDPYHQNTLRIDLWSKDMSVEAMKQFCIESISGMADTIKNATGDEFMGNEMKELCKKLVKHIEEEEAKKQS